MQGRIIMLVDFDYFFAQCEEIRKPSLKDMPLVVCVYSGRSEDSGAVSTANYIARRYGVKSGMSIYLAKKKLKERDAVFLPVDHRFYGEVSDRVMRILRSHANRFEQVGIDEAYLDVTQKANENFQEAKKLAQQIKEEVKAKEGLTCSIGVGPNKLVAKIAADFEKPDGLTVVTAKEVESFLFPLSVDRVVGIGARTAKKMRTLGVRTIGDLANCDVGRLTEVFGKHLGTYFHNASMGIDDEPVQQRGEPESISRISTLKEDTRDLDTILRRTDLLCEEVNAIVVERGISFRSVGTIMILKDLSTRTRSRTFDTPTNQLEVLKRTVRELLERFISDSKSEIRRVGVEVSNFAKEKKTQKKVTDFIDTSN